jgi:hypothetical protein
MKKVFASFRTACVFSLAVCVFLSCSKDNSNSATTGEADFSVYLTDDPSPYDKVNIDIESVEIHFSDDSGANGWHTLNMISPGVYDLLELSNGKDTLLATQKIAAKKITQVRFVLGDNNSVVVDGNTYPLETPSAEESGLKFNVDATLTAGIDYKIWTDFDVARSIVVTGSNHYILKPVIRVFTKALSGSISGIVLPAESAPWVYVLNGSDTVASASPDSLTGKFMVNGLSEGGYNVSIDGNNNYNDTTYNDVMVSTANVTDIGTTVLHQ